MICPFCQSEMVKGYLYGDRYALKWQAEDSKLIAGIWSAGGIKFKKNSVLGRPRTESFMCKSCKKMVIDVNTQAE